MRIEGVKSDKISVAKNRLNFLYAKGFLFPLPDFGVIYGWDVFIRFIIEYWLHCQCIYMVNDTMKTSKSPTISCTDLYVQNIIRPCGLRMWSCVFFFCCCCFFTQLYTYYFTEILTWGQIVCLLLSFQSHFNITLPCVHAQLCWNIY